MGSSVTAMLTALLLRLSEAGPGTTLSGRAARQYPGRTLDRLLAAGVIEETAEASEWSPCDDCDCAFGFRPIRRVAGRIVAACPLDPGSDLELEPADLREFHIDAGQLLSLIGAASGLSGPVEVIAPGLWHLGRLGSGRVVAVALPARALRSAGSILLLKNCGGPVTVLASKPEQATRLRLVEAGIDLVELSQALCPNDGPVARLAPALLEPKGGEPQGEAELVVRKGAAAVEWRGTTIGFSHQQFPVLLRLLEGARSRSRITSGPAVEDMTGREAKDLIRELRQRVEAAGFSGADAKSLFKAVHGRGYTLGVAPEKIAVDE